MAKRGYKQGAMSATDAITQLRAAAAKCDNKWMKAHAASARFFGAREADVKHALKRCGTIKSSLLGTRLPENAAQQARWRRRRGGEQDPDVYGVRRKTSYDPLDRAEFDLTSAAMHTAEHRKAMSLMSAEANLEKARKKCKTEGCARRIEIAEERVRRMRKDLGLKGARRKRGVGMFDQVAAAMEPGDERDYTITIERGYKGHSGYTGDMRGLKGSSPQHFGRAKAHFSAADEELEWAASPAVRAYGGQKKVLAIASRQLTAGMVNCDWVRSKKAKQVCHAEEKRLIRKLAKLEGDDRVLTHNFALDGTRKRAARKRARKR